MVICRYVGSGCSEIGDREFDAVGQCASFSEQGFREAVLGNAPFITEAEFEKIGFDDGELSLYGPQGSRVDPPQSFCDKLATAQEAFRDLRLRMERRADEALADATCVEA